MGLEPRVQLDVACRSENFLVDYLLCLDLLLWNLLLPNLYRFGRYRKKQLLKDSPRHFFVAGMNKYFPTSFWWSLSVLLPYWEEIYSLNWVPPL